MTAPNNWFIMDFKISHVLYGFGEYDKVHFSESILKIFN